MAPGNPEVRPDASISSAGAGRLTPQQERDLAIAAQAGDATASRKLVEAFVPSINGLARRFPTGVGVERQELVQEGIAGLLFAARRYDVTRRTPFWAYASFWVRKAMQELVAQLTRPMALSDRAIRGLARIKAARRMHLETNGSEPTNDDLSRASGFTRAHVESLLAVERTPRGMEEPLDPDKGTTGTLGDTIVDPAAELAFDRVLDEIEISEARDFANELDERERVVIRGHYGLGQPVQTLNQIGGTLGLTAERARQIEMGALHKLHQALAMPTVAGGETD